MCDEANGDTLLVKRFYFKGLWKCESFCQLELQHLKDGRTMVIATELQENPGTSITNMAEGLAMEVCLEYGIDPTKLVWIEHYSYPAAIEAMRPRFYDRVSFKIVRDAEKIRFAEPEWRRMRDEDWISLGVVPRQAGP